MTKVLERQAQVELLKTFLDPLVYPPAFACHGPSNSGKTHTLKQLLPKSDQEVVAWLNVQQSITPRLVLQKALDQISQQLDAEFDGSCENAQQFLQILAQMVENTDTHKQSRFLLVLDRIDTLDGAQALYLPFSRLYELAPSLNLSVVFVFQSEEPKVFLSSTIPHVYFPRYTPEEAISILMSDEPPRSLAESWAPSIKFYHEFVRVSVHALCPYTDTNIERLRKLIFRLWPEFIDGDCSSNFAVQYQRKAHLFQGEGFIETVPTAYSFDLPIQARYLICAAFLASHNPERYDFRFFSRSKDIHAKRRRTAPRKEAVIPERAKPGKVFELERLMAIYHALLPDAETFVATIRTSTSLADLTSQNFITRSSPQSSFDDPLNSRTRWCANISFQFANDIAVSLGIHLEDYMVGETTEN